jgi:hypothetical protein
MIAAMILAVAVVAYAVYTAEDSRCTQEKTGIVRVRGKYGGNAEVCNGYDWVPYRVEMQR